nr:ThiF family adenylyltransferase [Nocardia bovistercoris]
MRGESAARSSGLLESTVLAAKSAAVVGIGSGGSTIAVALAQAGVGRLVLVDRDRLEIGNISRHACGFGDLGRRKGAAVADLLRGKNPAVDVAVHDIDVVRDSAALSRALEGVDLVIGATDSDASRFVVNQVGLDLSITALYGRVLTAAVGGDVVRVRPGVGPCLACVYTERFLVSRPREYSNSAEAAEVSPAYATDADRACVQVGLASDIAPIAQLITKLALLELSRGGGGHLEALDEDLLSDFYVWANRREGMYEGWQRMGFSYDKPSILRWYGAELERRHDCAACGASSARTTGFFGGAR